jgi:hypothetical protein
MDLRDGIPLEAMGIVDTAAREPPAGALAERLLVPGHPERSQLSQRLNAEAPLRMPPLARRTDPRGEALLREWIAAMAR